MKEAIRQVLSDNGTLSWGRVGSLLALASVIFWVTYLVLKTNTLPGLSDCSLFVTAPYIASKTATAVQSFSKQDEREHKS